MILTDVFFAATKKALSNITATYDAVWPTAVGLWNLRCMVNGVKKEHPNITESELAARFSLGSGIHGVNYKRAFVDHTWEQQQTNFAWILLNSTIPIYEGWLEELKQTYFSDLKVKELQFPGRVQTEITRIITTPSTIMRNSFYSSYLGKRDRCYSQIDALMHCYRVFKEARNCYMHNCSKADNKLVDAYSSYIHHATTTSLCVSEVPEFTTPVTGDEVKISLRGVVGFSYIVIKILVSLDTELLCASNAENEFISRYREKHKILRTLKPDIDDSRRQVEQYVRQCGFPTPQAVDDITSLLISHNLLRRDHHSS